MELPPGAGSIAGTPQVTLRSILGDPHIGPIIGLVFILLAGIGVVFPVMPLFARSFGVDYDGVGLFIGAFGFMRLFGDLIGGTVVDRKGERWTAIAGMALLALCATATGLAPNYGIALVCWAIAGVGSAVSMAALFSYVVKAAPSDRVARVLSFFYGAFNIGIIAGGALGGFVATTFGLAAPLFIYAAILLLGSTIYVPRFVRPLPKKTADLSVEAAGSEQTPAQAPLPSGGPIREMFRTRGFFTTMFLNFTYIWMVGSIFNTLLSLYASDELGISTSGIGGLFALVVAAEFVVLFPAGAWADRFGRKAVMVPGLAGLTVALATMGFATNVPLLCLSLVFLAVTGGFAGVPPAAMLSDIVPEEQKGRAIGVFRFFGDLGFMLGPVVAGAASKSYGFKTAFVLTAIPPAVGLVIMLRTPETLKARLGDRATSP